MAKSVYTRDVDELLPVWAQPHSFSLLDERQRTVFTFGLVLTHVRLLGTAEGVRIFGECYGYEWLPGLSDGVQRETREELPTSELQRFLREEHGIIGPRELDFDKWAAGDGEAGEPSDEILVAFAEQHGAQIKSWSLNAFNMVEVKLRGWAGSRKPVELGHGAAARKRLQRTQMPHELTSVNAIGGSQHWARQYTTLYERVALELEDLAVRRPKPRICPLCNRVYIPVRPGQSICANQIWDARSRRLLRRCVPTSEEAVYSAAEAAEYRKRRKTQWAAMDRVLKRYGPDDPRTKRAVRKFERWKKENPPPRPPGRPPTDAASGGTPPFRPKRQAARGKRRSNASTA